MHKPWFCLMGPTASGKTALACELIQHIPFEIISIDSAMIYTGMDIGSAKPDAAVLALAPHHLIDIRTPIETYSVAQCCEDVIRCGEAIEARGRIPLLVGGTMMYFRALQQGLSTLPSADQAIRDALMRDAEQQGWDSLHERLRLCDTISAARIHPHDTQRLIRALEVYQITGQPLSRLLEASHPKPKIQYANILLMPDDRALLHQRIETRFLDMVASGFIDEVMGLVERWSLTKEHAAMRSVGYRQAWDYLYEHQDYDLFLKKGIEATRQLAKRQLTWLRHWPNGHHYAMDQPIKLHEMIALIRQIEHNGH